MHYLPTSLLTFSSLCNCLYPILHHSISIPGQPQPALWFLLLYYFHYWFLTCLLFSTKEERRKDPTPRLSTGTKCHSALYSAPAGKVSGSEVMSFRNWKERCLKGKDLTDLAARTWKVYKNENEKLIKTNAKILDFFCWREL